MKILTNLLLTSLSILFIDCKHTDNLEPATTSQTPYFNQVNIAFTDTQAQCLLDQWYQRKYQNEPIVFRVINDDQAYAAFFGCTNVGSLTAIDFTKNSLLIGTKADYGQFINSPVNIRQITQALTAGTNGNYSLQVKVVGEASKNAQGGEWFAFTSVVPKITSTVDLDIQYQFN